MYGAQQYKTEFSFLSLSIPCARAYTDVHAHTHIHAKACVLIFNTVYDIILARYDHSHVSSQYLGD